MGFFSRFKKNISNSYANVWLSLRVNNETVFMHKFTGLDLHNSARVLKREVQTGVTAEELKLEGWKFFLDHTLQLKSSMERNGMPFPAAMPEAVIQFLSFFTELEFDQFDDGDNISFNYHSDGSFTLMRIKSNDPIPDYIPLGKYIQ